MPSGCVCPRAFRGMLRALWLRASPRPSPFSLLITVTVTSPAGLVGEHPLGSPSELGRWSPRDSVLVMLSSAFSSLLVGFPPGIRVLLVGESAWYDPRRALSQPCPGPAVLLLQG